MFNKDEILKARKEYLDQKAIDDIEEKKKRDIEVLRVVSKIVDTITSKVSTEDGKQELIKKGSCCVDLSKDLAHALYGWYNIADEVSARITNLGIELGNINPRKYYHGDIHYCYVHLKEDEPINNKTKETKEYSFFGDFFSGLFGVK